MAVVLRMNEAKTLALVNDRDILGRHGFVGLAVRLFQLNALLFGMRKATCPIKDSRDHALLTMWYQLSILQRQLTYTLLQTFRTVNPWRWVMGS